MPVNGGKMIDVIQEYLVAVGWKVDKESFNEANKATKGFQKNMGKFAKGLADNKAFQEFSKNVSTSLEGVTGEITAFLATTEGLILGAVAGISAAVIAAFTAMEVAVGAFTVSIAKADLQTEMFARRMFMTERNAKSLKSVMAAMGIESLDELNDVAFNPERRAQFIQLRQMQARRSASPEMEQGFKNVRALVFEFEKLSLTSFY